MSLVRLIAMMLVLVCAGSLLAACGGSDDGGADSATRTAESPADGTGAAGGDGEAVELEIMAEDLAFDKEELFAPPGAQVSLVFDNDDDGIPHNWSLYETEDGEELVFEGETFSGIDSRTYEFEAPDTPGTFFFRCDVHPTQMTGDFTVE